MALPSTSAYNNECPHEKCFHMELTRLEESHFSSPEEWDQKFPYGRNKWMDEGVNHKVNDKGNIGRELKRETWGIKIARLKNLIEFCNSIDEEIIIR